MIMKNDWSTFDLWINSFLQLFFTNFKSLVVYIRHYILTMHKTIRIFDVHINVNTILC